MIAIIRVANVALDSWLFDTSMLSAAGLVLARAWRVPRERWAWLFIGTGMAVAAIGDVVYAIWVPEGVSPSLADPFYLAFYAPGYIGLLLLVRTALRTVPTAILLDGLVVACTVAALSAALTFGPIKAAADGSWATAFVGLAYAAGDLTMLALAVGVLALLGWHTDRRWCLLVAGFIVWAVADTVYLFRTAEGAYLEGHLDRRGLARRLSVDRGGQLAPVGHCGVACETRARILRRARDVRRPCARGVVFDYGDRLRSARRCDVDRGRRPIAPSPSAMSAQWHRLPTSTR